MDHNGWVDIGYNWLVTQDGRLWEGRQGTWLAIGAHAANQNTAWVGVCWIGHSGNVAPSAAALAAIRWVVDEARRRAGRQLLVSGHGQLPGQATECPGSQLRAWIAAGLPTEDDMEISDRLDVPDWVRDNHPELGETISVGTALASGYGHARSAKDQVYRNAVTLEALLAHHAGQDVAAVVKAELDKAAARERTERAAERTQLVTTLTTALPDLLADKLGQVPPEQVRTAVLEGLATLRLVAEPAS
jgi:hypothetical protein